MPGCFALAEVGAGGWAPQHPPEQRPWRLPLDLGWHPILAPCRRGASLGGGEGLGQVGVGVIWGWVAKDPVPKAPEQPVFLPHNALKSMTAAH